MTMYREQKCLEKSNLVVLQEIYPSFALSSSNFLCEKVIAEEGDILLFCGNALKTRHQQYRQAQNNKGHLYETKSEQSSK